MAHLLPRTVNVGELIISIIVKLAYAVLPFNPLYPTLFLYFTTRSDFPVTFLSLL